jgi:hypothetical protein
MALQLAVAEERIGAARRVGYSERRSSSMEPINVFFSDDDGEPVADSSDSLTAEFDDQ